MSLSVVLVILAVISSVLLVRQLRERLFPQDFTLPALPEATEPFRDDGQYVEIGMRRSKVLNALFWQVTFLLGTSLIIVVLMRLRIIHVIPTTLGDFVGVVVAAMLVAVFAIAIVLEVARLLRRGPALMITSDGIEDQASLISTGFGLIRWHEIQLVMPMDASRKSARGWRQLAITLVNRRVVLRRQPHWKRVLRAVSTLGRPPLVYISGYYLSAGADDLVERINAFVEAHAPAGWVWPGIRRFLEDEDEDEATEADRVPGARES